jgi:DNA-directed RNA polymerase subunit M/transcription elongation factor TFIIS
MQERKRIDSPQGTTPRANVCKRAVKTNPKVQIERELFTCSKCGNKKGLYYQSEHSSRFNQTKCLRCGEISK